MAIAPNQYFFLYATLMLIFAFASPNFTGAQIGVVYGRNGPDLPPPSAVVQLFKDYNITRIRIYDTDPDTLKALCGSSIELTAGIPNVNIRELAGSQSNADSWVQTNVQNHPDVNFCKIVVGNEVFPINGDTAQYADFVLPAMRNIRTALDAANLCEIKVTTSVGTAVLEGDSYPPSKGDFRPELRRYLDPIVEFLVETGAPMFASIYPYFAYVDNKDKISLDNALLQPNSGITTPEPDGVYYDNLFYAIVDSMNAALEKSTCRVYSMRDGPPRPPTESGAAETGVPTEGGRDATASVDNARIYNNNLVRIVKNGTPRRPNKPIETYIFAMFDESDKPGDETERHFGLFNAKGQPKYPVDFN